MVDAGSGLRISPHRRLSYVHAPGSVAPRGAGPPVGGRGARIGHRCGQRAAARFRRLPDGRRPRHGAGPLRRAAGPPETALHVPAVRRAAVLAVHKVPRLRRPAGLVDPQSGRAGGADRHQRASLPPAVVGSADLGHRGGRLAPGSSAQPGPDNAGLRAGQLRHRAYGPARPDLCHRGALGHGAPRCPAGRRGCRQAHATHLHPVPDADSPAPGGGHGAGDVPAVLAGGVCHRAALLTDVLVDGGVRREAGRQPPLRQRPESAQRAPADDPRPALAGTAGPYDPPVRRRRPGGGHAGSSDVVAHARGPPVRDDRADHLAGIVVAPLRVDRAAAGLAGAGTGPAARRPVVGPGSGRPLLGGPDVLGPRSPAGVRRAARAPGGQRVFSGRRGLRPPRGRAPVVPSPGSGHPPAAISRASGLARAAPPRSPRRPTGPGSRRAGPRRPGPRSEAPPRRIRRAPWRRAGGSG